MAGCCGGVGGPAYEVTLPQGRTLPSGKNKETFATVKEANEAIRASGVTQGATTRAVPAK